MSQHVSHDKDNSCNLITDQEKYDQNSIITQHKLQIENSYLKKKLCRRNILLDKIRKAYHRDVFNIRQTLIGIKAGKSIDCLERDLQHNLFSKIDLRDGGFPLYSPEDCELRLKPCQYCGGHLDIIHLETDRIASLQEKEIKMLSRISDLEKKVRS